MNKRRKIMLIAGGPAVVILALLVWRCWAVLYRTWYLDSSRAAFIRDFRGQGVAAAIPLAILLVLVSIIPGAPNSVIAVVSGICLGAPLGFVINLAGLSVGNVLGARLVDRVSARHQRGRNAQLLDDLQHLRHPRVGLMLAYSIPFVPNTLVHVAAADMHLSWRNWAGLICLGCIPTAFFYAFGGDAVLRLRPGRLVLVAILLVASVALVSVIHHDRKRDK